MADSKLNEIIQTSLSNIKELADVNTIIGEQIKTPNGTIIIPVSKVSVGFVSGGVDYAGKNKNASDEGQSKAQSAAQSSAVKQANNFGGGGGTGISIQPVGFLVVKPDGDVEMLDINTNGSSGQAADVAETVSGLIEKAPSIIQKFKETFGKNKKGKKADDIDADNNETEENAAANADADAKPEDSIKF